MSYLWNSGAEADAIYTESWRAFVREKYAADPSVTYLESSVEKPYVSEVMHASGIEAAIRGMPDVLRALLGATRS